MIRLDGLVMVILIFAPFLLCIAFAVLIDWLLSLVSGDDK